MVDYCEYVPTDSTAANGMSGGELHNFYPYFYTKQLYELFNKKPAARILPSLQEVPHPAVKNGRQISAAISKGIFPGLRKAVNALLTLQ